MSLGPTRILILGGGFGGVYAALRLDKTLARRADVARLDALFSDDRAIDILATN